jgi:hypothetical protein
MPDDRREVRGDLRPCTTCHAPMIDPFPPTWDLELIKEGPADGPVRSYLTPHTDDCTALHADPHPGVAVRVRGHYVTNLTVSIPPVTQLRYATGGYVPTGATDWRPGDSDPIADLRAAKDAIENEPYRPSTTHLTGRAYRTMREIMARIETERANRRNIDGMLFYAPIANTDPPTTGSGSADVAWTSLGYTDVGYAFNDDGQYIPAVPPDISPPDPYADREDHVHWAGPGPTERQRREADEAIYGGPPADPEPQPGPATE